MKRLLALAMVLSVLLITLILAAAFMPAQPAYAESPEPCVHALPTENSIYMYDFSPNDSVTLAIYEPEGGTPIFGPESLSTDENGNARWQHESFDLLAGHYIVATDGVITKTLILIQHTFDLLDFENNVARGTAPPSSTVVVRLADGDPSLTVVADANGHWIADFDDDDIDFDIPPFMKGQAQIYDDDRDITFDEPPRIEYWGNQVSTRSFTPEAPVTIALYDAPGGDLLWGLENYPTNTDGDLLPHLDFGAHSVRPVPGNYLVITDTVSTYSKTLIVPDDTVNPVDYENDLVTGTALPFAPVKAHVDTESGEHYSLDLFADENGNWTADFGAMGVDLDWNTSHGAWILDEDRDEINIPPVPTVGPITAPVGPVQVNTEITASAEFTDPLEPDTPDAVWDWGDGGTTTKEHVVSPASAPHTYAEPGVYTVKLRVTDDHVHWGESTYQYLVVYDLEGGFVTGGGWIDSPVGAYTADPALTGKATFGFVSKYKKGADTPSGETQFRFTVADLNFHSTSYQWLVVGGARAQFKGTGTINGAGDYGFMLTAIDGQIQGGGGIDKFRIKIWEKATDIVVYDNKVGEPDNGDAATVLGGGSIVIHKK